MSVIFFILSSGTTFNNESCSQDARKFVKRKDPPRTHNNQTGEYYTEFRLDNISSKKIEVEIEFFGNAGKIKERKILQPGLNTIYTEKYRNKERKYGNYVVRSAMFVPD